MSGISFSCKGIITVSKAHPPKVPSPKYFTELVKLSNDALNGKTIKTAEVKEEKSETKKETVKEEKDLSKLTVAELKEMAKAKGVEGYTKLKKAELIDALK